MNWRCFFKHDWEIIRETHGVVAPFLLLSSDLTADERSKINDTGNEVTYKYYWDGICRRCETPHFGIKNAIKEILDEKKYEEQEYVRRKKLSTKFSKLASLAKKASI
jgi:hypothetical protein